MAQFLLHSLAFPTVIFSLLLVVVIVYWLIAAFGLVGLDSLDIETPDIDSSELAASGLTAILLKFRLNGVPLTLVISLFTLYGWLLSYFIQLYLLSMLPIGVWHYVLGAFTLLPGLLIALQLTALTLKPLRHWLRLRQGSATTAQSLIGKSAVVRSPIVSQDRGEAILEDGGAGLIVKVRALDSNQYQRGERIVILDYHPEMHCYSVVSELEFKLLT